MSEHDLILRHFAGWLDKKGQSVDVDLVGRLLDLREQYDDTEPTYWAAGSVDDLLLRLWPAKGDGDAPDSDALVAAMESWFKFLRNTGRMSARSGDVKELVKEARRAAPRMGEVAADPQNWSQSKSLLEFGRSQGIDLEDAPDLATAQARLAEIQAGWNALPMHERRRLMPLPSDPDLTERERLMSHHGVDDPIVALLLSFEQELPSGDLSPPSVTGPQFAASSYLRQVIGFSEWARPGQPLTDTDNLRLKPAREAYDLLGLEAWTRDQLQLPYRDRDWLPAGIAAAGLDNWVDQELARPWRSASDSQALERLWWGGQAAGLLRMEGRKLVGDPPGDLTDDDWLALGCRACHGIFEWLEGSERLALVVNALMRSYVSGRSRISYDELDDFSQAWLFRPSFLQEYDDSRAWHGHARGVLGLIADTGLIDADDAGVRLTEAGDVFVTWWLKLMEQ